MTAVATKLGGDACKSVKLSLIPWKARMSVA